LTLRIVTALKIFEPESARKDTSLGRPVRNVKCYILNPFRLEGVGNEAVRREFGAVEVSLGNAQSSDMQLARSRPL
jgi:hypothetical protein